MFKIMQKMIYDLGKFLCVWSMILCAFSCVSTLIFGDLEQFKDVQTSILYYFQCSLGDWDYDIPKGMEDGFIVQVYEWFLMVFLLINMIILLNFVIAILGNTFAQYEPQTQGLYLSVLITKFPFLCWDETYGCIPCSHSPINMI